MNNFEYYLKEGKVKNISVDKELANSLKNDAIERAKSSLSLDPKLFSKIIFENVYDAIRGLLDAILALEGYKSYSHEASIAYLKKFNIEDSIVVEIDDFRYKRNSSKYYGKNIGHEEVEKIIVFYRRYSPKLLEIVSNCAKK